MLFALAAGLLHGFVPHHHHFEPEALAASHGIGHAAEHSHGDEHPHESSEPNFGEAQHHFDAVSKRPFQAWLSDLLGQALPAAPLSIVGRLPILPRAAFHRLGARPHESSEPSGPPPRGPPHGAAASRQPVL
jgi:hypothetical protein